MGDDYSIHLSGENVLFFGNFSDLLIYSIISFIMPDCKHNFCLRRCQVIVGLLSQRTESLKKGSHFAGTGRKRDDLSKVLAVDGKRSAFGLF